jgi:DNA-binding NtrC family response regulator
MAKKNSTRILIVDDDAAQRSLISGMLEAFGFEPITAFDGEEAIRVQARTPADVIITDLRMPRMDGMELLRVLERGGDRTPTIVLTAFGSVEKAISVVFDLKAFWFLEKPVQPAALRALLERAIAQKRLIDETALLNRQLSHQGVLCDLVGSTPAMRQVYSLISQVAPTSAAVLITGESGTGKELAARAIHRRSPRAGGPFIAINCAALPETLMESELFGHEKGAFTGAVERHAGCFEQAHGGTVLLDEIGDMPIATQAKLLRVLEESSVRRLGGNNDFSVDVRVIAATNRNLLKALREKRLREDLYYRLNVFQIELPPLRDRKDDIPMICAAMLANLNQKHGCRIAAIDPDVLEEFRNDPWPGNIRQLRNVLERAMIIAGQGTITLNHLSRDRPRASDTPACKEPEPDRDDALHIRVGPPVSELEKAYIDMVLKHTNGNKAKAARILGLSIRTLHNRLREGGAGSPEALINAAAS